MELRRRSLNLFILILPYLLATSVVANTCYYPDGSIANADQPCYVDEDVSFCCGIGDACMSNKICRKISPQEDGRFLVRGTCTDESWSSDECPQFCTGTSHITDSGNGITACSGNTFACYRDREAGDCDVADETVEILGGTDSFTTIGVLPQVAASDLPSDNTSTSTSSSPSTAAVTSSSSSSSDDDDDDDDGGGGGGLSIGAKAGIGVGVGLGVIGLIVGIFIAWRLVTKAKRNPVQASYSDPNFYQKPMQQGLGQWGRAELPANQRPPTYEI